MASINKVILVGHVGADPETNFSQNGSGVTRFSMATSERWTDQKTHEKKERTEWHNIVTFGNLADICQKYVCKGMLVYVEGKLSTSEYESAEGVKKRSTSVVGQSVQFLSGSGNSDHQDRKRSSSNQYDNRNYRIQNNSGTVYSEPDISF